MPHSQLLEWDADDRAKLMAFLLENAERCDMCGTASWEWEENRFAYEATDSFCHGCYLKSVYADTGQDSMPGTSVSLVPNTEYRKAKRKVDAEKARARMKREQKEAASGRGDGAGKDS